MRGIDRRIVEMQFDNRQFQAGVKDTLGSLNELKQGLSMDGAGKGLSNLERAVGAFDLSGMATGVDHISNKFSALGVVGFTVINELTKSAMNFGRKVAGVIFNPLVGGGKQRALNIEKAKFQFEGLGMDVEATMASALEAVTGTAYGLDEAAVAASQFGASGLRAGDEMTSALRAISGVAAMTGSSYSDISSIFTTVAGNGRLMGAELLRLSSRGINAAATLAEEFGVTEMAVREMVSKGEISFEMFYQAMDGAFGEHATKANDLYTGSLANVRAGLSRIGADVAASAFENQRLVFVALIPVLRDLHGVLVPAVEALDRLFSLKSAKTVEMIESINLEPLKEALPSIVDGLWNLGVLANTLITPIKQAFRDIFPPTTGDQLIAFAEGFKRLTEQIKIGEETLNNIRRTAAGFFAVFSIIRTGIVTLIKVLVPLGVALLPIVDALLVVTASIGDFIVSIDNMLKGSTAVEKGFGRLTLAVTNPVKTINNAIFSLFETFRSFGTFDLSGLDSFIERVSVRFAPLGMVFRFVRWVIDGILAIFNFALPIFARIGSVIGQALSGFTRIITDAFSTGNFKPVIDLLNSGLFLALMLGIERVSNSLTKTVKRGHLFTGRFIGMLDGVRFSLETYQARLKADILIKIATAMAILAASLFVLSLIDSDRLTGSLAAMGVMFAQLVGTLTAFEKIMSSKGFGSISKVVIGLTALTIAIFVMSVSLRIIAGLNWERLLIGLTGLATMMAMMVGAVKALSGIQGGMIRAAIGLVILGVAVNLMAVALRTIGSIDGERLASGLLGLGVLLAQLAIFMRAADFGGTGIAKMTGLFILALALNVLVGVVRKLGAMDVDQLLLGLSALSYIMLIVSLFALATGDSGKLMATASAILILSVSMTIFARALERMGKLSLNEIVKGLGAFSGVLALIILAVMAMPKNLSSVGAGLLLMAVAVNLIAIAFGKMAGLSLEEIGRGLLALAGALTILTVALQFMSGNLKGAAALLVVSVSLNALALALKLLGSMSIGEIIRSLVVLSATLAIFGIAGMLLAPVVPVLLGLSGAMLLFGLAALAVGGGVFLLALGLASLAVSGAAAAASLAVMVTTIAGTIPAVMRLLAEGVIEFIVVLGEGAKLISEAIFELAKSIIEGFVSIVPLVVDAIFTMLEEILAGILGFIPKMYHGAIELMMEFLRGIRDNIGEATVLAVQIMVNFINGISEMLPAVIDAGFNMIISFINGLADAIRNNTAALIDAIKNLFWAVIEAAARVILGNGAVDLFKNAASSLMNLGFIKGIRDRVSGAREAARALREGALNAVKGRIAGFVQAGRDASNGFTSGIASRAKNAANAARNVASGALNAVRNRLNTKSPSKETEAIGRMFDEGFEVGLLKYAKKVTKASSSVADGALDALKSGLGNISDVIDDDPDIDPKITPVLDLSEMEEGLGLIDSLFSRREALDLALSSGRAEVINDQINQNGSDSQVSRNMLDMLKDLGEKDKEEVDLTGTITMRLEDDEGRIISISERAVVDLLRREGR